MRTSDRRQAAGALLLLAACRDRDAADAGAAPVASAPIACARGGAALRPVCTVERTRDAAGLLLTLRRPDGAFHRVRVTHDGRGVVAADGAEPARVTIAEGAGIDVAIGADRYRLPATIGTVR